MRWGHTWAYHCACDGLMARKTHARRLGRSTPSSSAPGPSTCGHVMCYTSQSTDPISPAGNTYAHPSSNSIAGIPVVSKS